MTTFHSCSAVLVTAAVRKSCRRCIAVMVAAAIPVLVAPAAASALTVSFDDLSTGTALTAYPSTNPVVGFGDPESAGFATGGPADGMVYVNACGSLYVEADGDTHSPPNMGNFQGCDAFEGGTFPARGSFATLFDLADSVSAYVGSPDSSDTFELDAYDQNRDLLGSSTITASAAGPNNLISYSTPGVYDIAYFAIYERQVSFLDPATLIGIDDLSVDTCTPNVNCVPGVDLPPAALGGAVAQSATAQYQVHLTREDDSTRPGRSERLGPSLRERCYGEFQPEHLIRDRNHKHSHGAGEPNSGNRELESVGDGNARNRGRRHGHRHRAAHG